MPKQKPKDASPSGGEIALPRHQPEIICADSFSANVRKDALQQLREAILQQHHLALAGMVDTLFLRIECGRLLSAAREFVARDWEKWVADNFSVETGLSLRTAQRYMRDYRLFQGYLKECSPDDEATNVSPQKQRDLLLEYCRGIGAESRQAVARPNDVNDWISPQSVVKAVEQVLGEVDCDPCSSQHPQAAALARTQYTVAENGLASDRPWCGRAWIAPGHQGDLTPWTTKAVAEFDAGNLTDAIVCLPITALDLPPRLLECPIAIARNPLTVGYPNERGVQSRRLSMLHVFLYLSRTPNVAAFAEAFGNIAVVFRHDFHRSTTVVPTLTSNKE